MLDLHIHTTYSDGREGIPSVLDIAEKSGAEIISITDHDTMKPYPEIREKRDMFSGRIIPGAEFSAIFDSFTIEILAYGICPEKCQKEFEEKFHPELYRINQINASKLMMSERKVKFDEQRFELNLQKHGIKYAVYQECLLIEENKKLLKNPENLGTFSDFFRNEMYDPDGGLFVDSNKIRPSGEKIISFIHENGGLAFLAHPFILFPKNREKIEKAVRNLGVDGIECKYPTFNEEMTSFLTELAKKEKKYISGGSDFHGSQRPNKIVTGLDGNLSVTYEDVSDWIEKAVYI